jgi:hypothetical protein
MGVATSSPLIDWSLLVHVVLYSLVAGVGVVAAFSIGLVGLSYARNEGRPQTQRTASLLVAVMAAGVLVAALWWGFVLITNKG